MPGAKYAQLSVKTDDEAEVETTLPPSRFPRLQGYSNKMALSLMMILLYFGLSISLTFYQRWLLQGFSYPLTVAMYHLVVKWCLAVVVRTFVYMVTGQPQLCLSLSTSIRSVAPMGLASGVDVGFSNWGLALVTISLYTMTKSTTIIFILGFAILLGLEKKSWSLVGIVASISAGLVMFTYKATHFDALGFSVLVVASLAAGLRWSCAQHLLQRAQLGLHSPLAMLYHVQPWMFASLLPAALLFEGLDCFRELGAQPAGARWALVLRVSVGAYIAFAMELSEFLVVTYTSSLTLSIAGIFKEMCILVLAVKINGDVLSAVNVGGLVLCVVGIAAHAAHKLHRAHAAHQPHHPHHHAGDAKSRLRAGGEVGAPLLAEEGEDSDAAPPAAAGPAPAAAAAATLLQVARRRDPL